MVTAVISHCLFTCCRSALAQILVCGCGHDHDGEEVEVEGVMGGGRKIAPPIPNGFLRSVTVSPAACVNNMKEKWCYAIWFRIQRCAVERASLIAAGDCQRPMAKNLDDQTRTNYVSGEGGRGLEDSMERGR